MLFVFVTWERLWKTSLESPLFSHRFEGEHRDGGPGQRQSVVQGGHFPMALHQSGPAKTHSFILSPNSQMWDSTRFTKKPENPKG